MTNLSTFHAAHAAAIASQMIRDGVDPKSLVHVLYHPQDWQSRDWQSRDGEIQGLSIPLLPGTNLAGYTERYYTLEELMMEAPDASHSALVRDELQAGAERWAQDEVEAWLERG
jgi:hypothetical protein